MADHTMHGGNKVDKYYLGNVPVDKVFLGDALVYPTVIIVPKAIITGRLISGAVDFSFEPPPP